MDSLPLVGVASGSRPAATYAASVLHALAREESLGRRPQRLLEANRATWARFRGRLDSSAFLDLILEDAAVTQPVPFDQKSTLGVDVPQAPVAVSVVDGWLDSLRELDLKVSPDQYITAQAKLLGLPTRMAKASLHKVKPHHRVLELPGTGGQLAHFMVQAQKGEIYLQDVFTIACGSWQERVLAGLVSVENAAPKAPRIILDKNLEIIRKENSTFDYVVGLDPDRDGFFERDKLKIWFPTATLVLV